MKFVITPLQLNETNWLDIFTKPLTERANYVANEEVLSYTQVAGNILGVPLDIYSFKEQLYSLVYDRKDVHLLTTDLDKSIDNKVFLSIQSIMKMHKQNNGLSVNRFIAFMEGESLLPLKEIKPYYIHLRNTYKHLLEVFHQQHGDLLHNDFQRIIIDTVKWLQTYLAKWVNSTDYTINPIKVIWYGEATKSQTYFLYLLYKLGIDVLVFHTEGMNIFSTLECVDVPAFTYPSTLPLEPFPTTKPTRKATVAKKASSELDTIFHADGTYLFKPWQFRDYIPKAITLHTTYDEINIITKEKAFIRPNFNVVNNTVEIPHIFSKILGIATDKKSYWNKIREITNREDSLTITEFPFTQENKSNNQFHFKKACTNGILDSDKMLNTNWWTYKHLPQGLQIGIAKAISRYVDKATFKQTQGESLEALQLYLFSQALTIPKNILQLLQKFDYSQDVPKIVLFNNGKSGTISKSDCALLLLLNELGFDIIIYNPTGENDIEFYLDSISFDNHWLEEISFDETYHSTKVAEKTSVIKTIFSVIKETLL